MTQTLNVAGLLTDQALIADCIQACRKAAAASNTCADNCLRNPSLQQLATALRSDLNCAGACVATVRALSRRSFDEEDLPLAQVSACAEVCQLAADACERYRMADEFSRLCARACRECYRACRRLLQD